MQKNNRSFFTLEKVEKTLKKKWFFEKNLFYNFEKTFFYKIEIEQKFPEAAGRIDLNKVKIVVSPLKSLRYSIV